MTRLDKAAAFVKTNVPLGQESKPAVDVAARQRGADFARKSQDWPKGNY